MPWAMCFWAFSPSLTSLLVLPDSNNYNIIREREENSSGGKSLRSRKREDLHRGCKEKHPTMLKIATDDAKISCRNAVASYICIANCAILFALDVVLRRPETSATKGDGVRCPIGRRTGSDRMADGI